MDHFGIANGFGLCDMHGNVWEWCKDHYGEYDQIPTDGSAFSAEEKGASRVIRGGSWVYQPAHCRSHWRDKVVPTDWVYNIGFRVCCSAPKDLITLYPSCPFALYLFSRVTRSRFSPVRVLSASILEPRNISATIATEIGRSTLVLNKSSAQQYTAYWGCLYVACKHCIYA